MFKKNILCLILLLFSSSALAHQSGFNNIGFWSGLWHPISGIDHLLVMVGIGIWSVSMQSRHPDIPYFMLPVTFLISLSVGAVLARNDWILPVLEVTIAASVLILGIILMTRALLSFSAALLLVSSLALWHGNAHGLEAVSVNSVLSFGIGFICSAALLLTTGYALGRNSIFQKYLQTLMGFLSCLLGGTLIILNA